MQINNNMMLALDTETTGLSVRKDKVIGFSYSNGREHIYIEHLTWNGIELIESTPFKDCVDLLKSFSCCKLLTFNGAFDLQMIKNYFGVDLTDSLHLDAQLANHTCDENRSGGLKDLSKWLLGANSGDEQTELKENLKSKGAGAKEYYKADSDIIAKYARKDAELTYKLSILFLREMESQNLSDLFFEEIMPLYKLVILPMISKGIRVDVELLKTSQSEMQLDMIQFHNSIISSIKPLLDKFYNWFFAKNYPLKSRGKVFSAMKSGLSLRQAQEFCAKKDSNEETFNILSKHHLKRLFFDIQNLTPLTTTDLGSPQVDDDFLESIEDDQTWVKDLRLYNKLTKIKSSYVDRILEEQEDGIFYPEYFLHRTVSGRMSSDFQQLPRPLEQSHPLLMKYNNRIRDFFITRDGCIFIDDDYNSLEPRIFAAVAGDKALVDIFKSDEDFYSKIAIMVGGLTDVSASKSASNYLGKVNKAARQTAKAYSLGIAYGLDSYKLHKDLNISQGEAEKLIKGYFDAFPMLASWMQKTRETILTTGRISTRFGRVRRQQSIPNLYEKHGKAILNSLDLWKKYNESPLLYKNAKEDYKKVRHAINNAYNHQIQGLASHVLNRAAIAVAIEYKEKGLDAHIIACIHDEIIIECAIYDKEEAAAILKRCMETTTIIETPLEAEPSFGHTIKEAKGA